MGSGGGGKLNTFVGFSCWICRSKSLQPGMHNLNSLLKCWVREADRGRRGDEARCSIFTVQSYSAWLLFPRCVGCKPHFWILLPQADLLVWIMSLWCFVEGSQRHLSAFNFLSSSRLPSVVFLLQSPCSGGLLAPLQVSPCWNPLAKKNVGGDLVPQTTHPRRSNLVGKKSHLEHNLLFAMGWGLPYLGWKSSLSPNPQNQGHVMSSK